MGYQFLKQCGIVLGLLFFIGGIRPVADAYPVKFTLSQVDVYLPYIRIFACLSDENTTPIDTPSKDDIIIKLDGKTLPVKEIKSFKDSGEGVAYTLLLDISKTMKGTPFQNSVYASIGLIRNIRENDRIAVITFGDDVKIINDFSNDKEKLISGLLKLEPNHENTHFFAGVNQAFSLNMRRDSGLPIRRAILIITDGKDEGSGITLDDLIRHNEKNGIPIYSIGYTNIDPVYLNNLKRLSDLSGGNFLRSQDAQEFGNIYIKTYVDIYSQFLIETEFPQGQSDGSFHQIYVSYSKDGYSISTEKKAAFIFAKPIPDTPEPKTLSDYFWLYIIAGSILLLFIIILILLRAKKRKAIFQSRNDEQGYEVTSETSELPEQNFQYSQEVDSNTGELFNTSVPSLNEQKISLPVLQFIVISGKQTGKSYNVSVGQNGIKIGRGNTDIVVYDEEVSKVHCSVSWMNNHFMIKDEGSKNCTFLNGIPLKTRSVINEGDTIEIGQTTLRIKVMNMPVI